MSRHSKKDKSGKGTTSNEAVGGEGGDDVFPDLHHKMSKKIAQLTKVIYHLNTKNEDHSAMMEALNMQHEMEIELLSKDAQARMATQKEMAEMKQKIAIQQTQMVKLGAKHSAEKQKTIAEFEKFKANAAVQQEQLASDWQFKCDTISDDVEKMNKKFGERVLALDEARKSIAAGLDAAKSSSGEAAAALARKHEEEIEELVRAANQKYQDMVIQNLQATEALKAEYEAKIAELKAEMESFGQARMEQELGQLRAKMQAEMQEALMKSKREADAALQSQRTDLMAKLEKALGDIKVKGAMCIQLEEENQMLKKQMDGEVGALLQKHKADMEAAEQKIQNASIESAQLRQQVKNLQQDVSDAQDTISHRTQELAGKEAIVIQREGTIAELQEKIQQLQMDLLNTAQTGAAGQDQLTKQLQETRQALASSQQENSTLEKQRAGLESSLASLRAELTDTVLAAKSTQTSLEQSVMTEKAEKAALQARLDQLAKNSSSESEQLMRDMAALRQKLTSAEREMAAQAEKFLMEHAVNVAALEEKSRRELDGMKKMNDALFDKNSELGLEMDELKKENEARVVGLRKEHEAAVEVVRKEAKDAENALKLIVAQLENQIENLSANADSEKAAREKELTKSLERVKSLKQELDAKKKEGEGAQGVITGLKSQIDSLREELKASQKAFRDKMDMGLIKLEEDWQKKMDAVIEKHGQALVDAVAAAEDAMAVERSALVANYEQMQSDMQAAADGAAEQAAAALAASQKEAVRVLFLLKTEQADRDTERLANSAKHTTELEELKKQALADLEELRAQMGGDASSQAQALADKHAKEIAALKEHAAKAATDAETAQVKALQAAAQEAQKAQTAALEDQLAKSSAQFKASAAEVTKKHDEAMAAVVAKNIEASTAMQKDLSEIKTRHTELRGVHSKLEQELKEAQAAAAKQALQDKMSIQNLIRDNDLNVRNEKEAGQKALLEQQKRLDADAKLLQMEFDEDRSRFERSIQEANYNYSLLLEKYQNRESRPDDIARIQQLEYEMIEKDELVKTTRDEMLYLKRELMNREESYNSKFNATPTVGVMQVIKDPSSKASSTKIAPGAKSNKPTRVVGAQPGMGMGGMTMGGIGGSGAVPGIPGANKGAPPLPSGSREGRR